MRLYDPKGKRLYLTLKEREDFLEVALKANRYVGTFGATLCYTGCRLSEALQLTLTGLISHPIL